MTLPPAWRDGLQAIVLDRDRGASRLALDAIALLEKAADASDDLDAIVDIARSLRAARPSMPVISNLVNLAMHEAARASAARDVPAALRRSAKSAHERALEARGAAARQAAGLARGVVLTHSASETVTKALRAAARAGQLSRVVVAEGRPGFEGRQVARALAAEGVDVDLVVDAALGLHAREADLALVGADAVLADGSVVNKVGTRLLALACAGAGTPLHAVADRFKVSPASTLPLEEKGPAEVWAEAPDGVRVRNIYFDRTEAPLVKSYVTDAGTLGPGDVERLADENAAWAGWEARVRALQREA